MPREIPRPSGRASDPSTRIRGAEFFGCGCRASPSLCDADPGAELRVGEIHQPVGCAPSPSAKKQLPGSSQNARFHSRRDGAADGPPAVARRARSRRVALVVPVVGEEVAGRLSRSRRASLVTPWGLSPLIHGSSRFLSALAYVAQIESSRTRTWRVDAPPVL